MSFIQCRNISGCRNHLWKVYTITNCIKYYFKLTILTTCVNVNFVNFWGPEILVTLEETNRSVENKLKFPDKYNEYNPKR